MNACMPACGVEHLPPRLVFGTEERLNCNEISECILAEMPLT